jgi:hypothetical protein
MSPTFIIFVIFVIFAIFVIFFIFFFVAVKKETEPEVSLSGVVDKKYLRTKEWGGKEGPV